MTPFALLPLVWHLNWGCEVRRQDYLVCGLQRWD